MYLSLRFLAEEINRRFPCIGKAASPRVYCFSRDRKSNNSGSACPKSMIGPLAPSHPFAMNFLLLATVPYIRSSGRFYVLHLMSGDSVHFHALPTQTSDCIQLNLHGIKQSPKVWKKKIFLHLIEDSLVTRPKPYCFTTIFQYLISVGFRLLISNN